MKRIEVLLIAASITVVVLPACKNRDMGISSVAEAQASGQGSNRATNSVERYQCMQYKISLGTTTPDPMTYSTNGFMYVIAGPGNSSAVIAGPVVSVMNGPDKRYAASFELSSYAMDTVFILKLPTQKNVPIQLQTRNISGSLNTAYDCQKL